MRIRDSGMPDEGYWESLFDVPHVLASFNVSRFHDIAELGCGYGTFSIPVAEAIGGTLYTFDIEPAMVKRTRERAIDLPIVVEVRDVIRLGFGVQVDAVLLFNILHCEHPTALLKQAASALKPTGEVLVIHWRHDIPTPRGPSLDIRPTPDSIIDWAKQSRSLELVGSTVELPPWHYGLRFGLTTSAKNR